MEIITCKDATEVAEYSFSWLKENIIINKFEKIYLPAGNTPKLLYNLIEKYELPLPKLYQIDEVLDGKFLFKNFFIKYLPSYRSNFTWVNEEFTQADIAILGLGLNGHVAFHEPSLPKNFKHGVVHLSEKTCDNLNLKNGTEGISYGTQAFNNCKKILLMVTGENKREILSNLVNKNNTYPATTLLNHQELIIVTDIEI